MTISMTINEKMFSRSLKDKVLIKNLLRVKLSVFLSDNSVEHDYVFLSK
jgi:hypothetical protein